MRSVTLRIRSEDPIQAVPEAVARRHGFSRGPIHHIELLPDGTAVQLREATGDLAAYRELTRDHEGAYDLVVSGDREGYVYAHFDPSGATRRLLEWRRQSELIIEGPVRVEDDHTCVLTLVGEAARVRTAMGAVPDGVTSEVLSAQRYRRGERSLLESLTDRQREVLEAAVDEGYYDHPRTATQADLAAHLGLSPATVGEHLRKTEAAVFSRALGR